MTSLIRVYDSSAVSASLLTTLASAGFADLALLLAQNDAAFQLSFLDQAAAKAAAGQFRDAVGQAVADHRRSMCYPKYDCLAKVLVQSCSRGISNAKPHGCP